MWHASSRLNPPDLVPPPPPSVARYARVAAAAGGAASVSGNTSYIESAAGVGEGARTGLASVVTGVLFVLTTLLAPLVAVVGFVSYVLLKSVRGKARAVHPLLWVVAALFVVYFAIGPIEEALGLG